MDKYIKAAADVLEAKEKVEKEGLLQISQIQSQLDKLEVECSELRDIKMTLEKEIELKTKNWQDQAALQENQFTELQDQCQKKVTEFEAEIQRIQELNVSLKGVVEQKDTIINDTRKKLRGLVTENKALKNNINTLNGEKQQISDEFSAATKRFTDELRLKEQNLEVNYEFISFELFYKYFVLHCTGYKKITGAGN